MEESEIKQSPMVKTLLGFDDFIVSIPDEDVGIGKLYFFDMEGNIHIKPKVMECFKEDDDSCIFTYDFW